jgi:hypothetical protein
MATEWATPGILLGSSGAGTGFAAGALGVCMGAVYDHHCCTPLEVSTYDHLYHHIAQINCSSYPNLWPTPLCLSQLSICLTTFEIPSCTNFKSSFSNFLLS